LIPKFIRVGRASLPANYIRKISLPARYLRFMYQCASMSYINKLAGRDARPTGYKGDLVYE